MYKSLIISYNEPKEIKKNYFKVSISFFLGSSEYKELLIETSEESEVLNIANDLEELTQWFTEESMDYLIDSDLLKENLVQDIFEMEDEGQELRFDNEEGDFSAIWIDNYGNECRVDFT